MQSRQTGTTLTRLAANGWVSVCCFFFFNTAPSSWEIHHLWSLYLRHSDAERLAWTLVFVWSHAFTVYKLPPPNLWTQTNQFPQRWKQQSRGHSLLTILDEKLEKLHEISSLLLLGELYCWRLKTLETMVILVPAVREDCSQSSSHILKTPVALWLKMDFCLNRHFLV